MDYTHDKLMKLDEKHLKTKTINCLNDLTYLKKKKREWDGSGSHFEWERDGIGNHSTGVGRDGICLFTPPRDWDGMGFFSLGAGWDGSENPLPCHALTWTSEYSAATRAGHLAQSLPKMHRLDHW